MNSYKALQFCNAFFCGAYWLLVSTRLSGMALAAGSRGMSLSQFYRRLAPCRSHFAAYYHTIRIPFGINDRSHYE